MNSGSLGGAKLPGRDQAGGLIDNYIVRNWAMGESESNENHGKLLFISSPFLAKDSISLKRQ